MYSTSYPQPWQSREKYRFQFWLIVGIVLIQTMFSAMPASAQQGGQIDIVFAVDESGSMGNEHTTLQQNIQTVINGLQAQNLDWRFGLVTFGDSINSGAPVIISPLVNNTNALASLQVNGAIEPGFSATSLAVSNAMNFRPDAGKCVILISDEDADPAANPQHQQQQQQAIADLQTRPAVFFGIVNLADGTTQNDYGPNPGSLAAASGGSVFPIADFTANPTIVLQALTSACVSATLPAQICGSKFNDMNGNGVWDKGEPGLSGWQIVAQNQQGNAFSVTTGQNGEYCVAVPAGVYTVAEIQQAPWVQTFPAQPGTHSVTVQAGATVNNINFGNRLPNGSIRGIKFWDMNGNGVRDQIVGGSTLEPLLDGFQFSLYSGNPSNPLTWNLVAGPVTITNANAGYQFTNIPPGSYFIREVAKPGWTQTFPSQNNGAHVITLTAGQHVKGLDFGNKACQGPCTSYIMGFKFRDNNHNANWDSNEPRLGGVTIELLNASGAVIQTTTTNANGLYFFLNVPPGVYTVREQPMPGWVQTAPNTNGGVHTVTITHGVNGIEKNFGNYRCGGTIVAEPYPQDPPIDVRSKLIPPLAKPEACITGVKFHDIDGNGVQDANEPPLSGFVFELKSLTNPAQVFWATSDVYGNFTFIVPPGEYTLVEIYGLPSLDWSLSPNSAYVYHINAGPGNHLSGFTFGNWMCKDARDGRCQCGGGNLDVALDVKMPEVVAVGQKAQYVFTLVNAGSCAISGSNTLYLKLPTGVTPLEREWAMEGWRCQALGSTMQCVQAEALNDGAASTIPVDVLISADIAPEIQSCATFIARNDSNLKNNTVCVQSKVEGAIEANDTKVDAEATGRAANEGTADQSVTQPDTLRQKLYLPVTFH
jgi:hypothetical protein